MNCQCCGKEIKGRSDRKWCDPCRVLIRRNRAYRYYLTHPNTCSECGKKFRGNRKTEKCPKCRGPRIDNLKPYTIPEGYPTLTVREAWLGLFTAMISHCPVRDLPENGDCETCTMRMLCRDWKDNPPVRRNKVAKFGMFAEEISSTITRRGF